MSGKQESHIPPILCRVGPEETPVYKIFCQGRIVFRFHYSLYTHDRDFLLENDLSFDVRELPSPYGQMATSVPEPSEKDKSSRRKLNAWARRTPDPIITAVQAFVADGGCIQSECQRQAQQRDELIRIANAQPEPPYDPNMPF